MKKIYYFIFFTILSHNYLMGQSTNTKGMVMYNFILLQDTVTMMGDKETESFLFFDTEKKQSLYIYDRKSKARSEHLIEASNGRSILKIKNGGNDLIGYNVFKDYTNSKVVCRQFLREPLLISDTYTIDWVIREETRKIQDMVVQKAECDFRGRHYTAWFNPKIPVSDGPWKLRGLPGLIMEAYDEKRHVQFLFTSYTFPAEFPEKIEPSTDGKPIVFDCKQYTINFYEMITELTKGTLAKVQQMGGTVTGPHGVYTNTVERCY
jgi:GLPGLI family protein